MKHTIQLDITTSNPFEAKSKMEALKALAKLDNETLTKLMELSKSQNAITQLKTNFEMIKGFLFN